MYRSSKDTGVRIAREDRNELVFDDHDISSDHYQSDLFHTQFGFRRFHVHYNATVAVGPGGMVDGKEVTMFVKVGDTVIYSKYAGTEVKLGDDEYIIVRQNDILAMVQ